MANPSPKVAVVGAAGFIGRALVESLRRAKEPVVSYTRAYPPMLPGDRLDPEVRDCRTVYWLASSINPLIAESDPASVRSDYDYFVRFVGIIVRAMPKVRVVLASSGGTVYGSATQPPFDEAVAPSPSSSYGRAKLALEHALLDSGIEDTIVARISNVYGPGQPIASGQGVVAHWLRAARRREDITLYGDPRATRDYIFIRDVAAAFQRIHEVSTKLPTVINIGSGCPVSLDELSELVIDVTGSESARRTVETGRTFDLMHSWLNVNLAKTVLSWTPTTELRSGISEAWDTVRALGDPNP